MDKKKETRAKQQARAAKAVWGAFFMVAGVLFGLENLGQIDLGAPTRHTPSRAVDGDPSTRWSSSFRDPQWLTVDLGAPTEIARVRLTWEDAYAKAYQIQVAEDPSHWTTVVDVTDGDGGIDEHEVSATARYVRMNGTARGTPFGYSLRELEVEPRAGSLAPARATATASSTEGVNYLGLYWPLLLVIAGLPALFVPKDGGDQVVALAAVGAGAFFQLRSLGLVAWTLREAAPMLLITAGFLMVVQALRRLNRNGTTPGFDVPPDPR